MTDYLLMMMIIIKQRNTLAGILVLIIIELIYFDIPDGALFIDSTLVLLF